MKHNGPTHFPRIGILGGGQLAKMTAAAATRLGCDVVILDNRHDLSAYGPGLRFAEGHWNDPATLRELADGLDVIALENEFVDPLSLRRLEELGHHVCPSSTTLSLVQDKLLQKELFADAGLPVVDFADAPTREAVSEHGLPAVLKSRRNSYDGRGNATVLDPSGLERGWRTLDGDRNPLYVESLCPFERELAIIVTRARDGSSVVYPVVETTNHDHICHLVQAPADVSALVAREVAAMATRAVAAIDGVGSFGLEFFLLKDGTVLLNEIAPRVHNTGHYTIEACECSQFENHVRALLGWPLGSPSMVVAAAAMVNLLGSGEGSGVPLGIEEALTVDGASLHVYGKSTSRRGRKMGHVTALGEDLATATERASRAAAHIRFGSERSGSER